MAQSEPARGNLRELPKAHLHLHLVGSMRPETLTALAEESGMAMALPESFVDFQHFYTTYTLANRAIRDPEHLRRLVFEVVEDAAIDGAVWVEPTLYLDSFAELIGPGELILDIVAYAIRNARDEVGIGARLIVSADRDLGPADALRQARLVARGNPDIIGAFGLVNDELAHPIEDFAEALAVASDAGLALVPHAGEFGGPDHVSAALGLGAARVQNGIGAAADRALLRRLAAATSASTCARPATLRSAQSRAWIYTRYRLWWTAGCGSASTPTILSCSDAPCSASTSRPAMRSDSPTGGSPASPKPRSPTAPHRRRSSRRPRPVSADG